MRRYIAIIGADGVGVSRSSSLICTSWRSAGRAQAARSSQVHVRVLPGGWTSAAPTWTCRPSSSPPPWTSPCCSTSPRPSSQPPPGRRTDGGQLAEPGPARIPTLTSITRPWPGTTAHIDLFRTALTAWPPSARYTRQFAGGDQLWSPRVIRCEPGRDVGRSALRLVPRVPVIGCCGRCWTLMMYRRRCRTAATADRHEFPL